MSGRLFPPARRSAATGGFTLLELLVALSLFAVLSLLTYTSLRAMITSREHTARESERLAAVQMAVARLGLEIQQAQARGIRDEYGNPQPAMHFGTLPGAGLEFTRGGRPLPLPGTGGGNLVRLRYLLDGDELIRESWPVLDRGPGLETFRQPILDGVEAFEIRFLDNTGVWHSYWPPQAVFTPGQAAMTADDRLPAAVEVWLELADWGRIRRLFPLAAGLGA